MEILSQLLFGMVAANNATEKFEKLGKNFCMTDFIVDARCLVCGASVGLGSGYSQ